MSLGALAAWALLAAIPTDGGSVLVESGVTLDATPSVERGRTDLSPQLTLRGGWLYESAAGLVTGADARLLVEVLPRDRGTSDVGSLSWSGLLEPRGLVGWRLGGAPLSLTPYLWAGLPLGVRLTQLRAGADRLGRSRVLYGVRGGAGALLRLGRMTLSWELGGGVRERGADVVGTLSTGFSF